MLFFLLLSLSCVLGPGLPRPRAATVSHAALVSVAGVRLDGAATSRGPRSSCVPPWVRPRRVRPPHAALGCGRERGRGVSPPAVADGRPRRGRTPTRLQLRPASPPPPRRRPPCDGGRRLRARMPLRVRPGRVPPPHRSTASHAFVPPPQPPPPATSGLPSARADDRRLRRLRDDDGGCKGGSADGRQSGGRAARGAADALARASGRRGGGRGAAGERREAQTQQRRRRTVMVSRVSLPGLRCYLAAGRRRAAPQAAADVAVPRERQRERVASHRLTCRRACCAEAYVPARRR